MLRSGPGEHHPLIPAAGLQVVTLTAHQLGEMIEAAVSRGYTRAAEERERVMAELAERLECAVAASGIKPWLTVREAALYVGRSEDTVRRWIKHGLPASPGTRGYLIARTTLDEWRAEASGAA